MTKAITKPDTAVLTKDQAERIDRIKNYHASCVGSFNAQMGFAFLCGAELNAAKEELPHGEFTAWREMYLPEIPQRSAARYMSLTEGIRQISHSVANLKIDRLQLVNGHLPEEEEKAVLAAVYEACDGKTLTQMYRDLGVIREKKHQKHTPPEEMTPEEIEKARTDLAVGAVKDLAAQVRLMSDEETETLTLVPKTVRKDLLAALVDLSKLLRSLDKPKNKIKPRK